MRHEMLTQRALFCHRANTKRGTLSQHFVTHVVPPLGLPSSHMQPQITSVALIKNAPNPNKGLTQ